MPQELSLMDIATVIMSKEKRSFELYDLYDRVCEALNLSQAEQQKHLTKFYTDLTTSAKFIYVGDNHWNLKANERIELWEKDGSFYKEYTVVELPEEYKVDPYAQTKKPKPPTVTVKAEPIVVEAPVVEEVIEEPVVVEVVEELKPIVEPVVEPVETDETTTFDFEEETEFEEEEVFDEYDDFDEEKYNEYMDTYEDQYED